jgi:hypothetical protein
VDDLWNELRKQLTERLLSRLLTLACYLPRRSVPLNNQYHSDVELVARKITAWYSGDTS